MTAPTAERDAALPHDLPCVACGYNLRGLSPAGRCPECGTAVVEALARGPMAGCDPAWLRRVARGVGLFNAVHLFTALLIPVRLSYGVSGRLWLLLLMAAATAVAVCWMTSREPAAGDASRVTMGIGPYLLRVTAAMWVGMISVITYYEESGVRPMPDRLVWVAVTLPLACLVLGLIEMARLAARAGERGLVAQLRVLALTYPALLATVYSSHLFDWLTILPMALRNSASGTLAVAAMTALLWTTFASGRLRQALSVRPGNVRE